MSRILFFRCDVPVYVIVWGREVRCECSNNLHVRFPHSLDFIQTFAFVFFSACCSWSPSVYCELRSGLSFLVRVIIRESGSSFVRSWRENKFISSSSQLDTSFMIRWCPCWCCPQCVASRIGTSRHAHRGSVKHLDRLSLHLCESIFLPRTDIHL